MLYCRGTNAAWFFDCVPSFDGHWDFDKVGSWSELVFFLLLHDPYHRAPLYDFRSSGNGSILWALLDCHTNFFGAWISLISYCSCNGVKLTGVTLLHLPSSSFDTPLQPLDVSPFSPLQQYSQKAIRRLFLTFFKVSIGLFYFLYL